MAVNPGAWRPGQNNVPGWTQSGPIATGTYNPDWNAQPAPGVDQAALDQANNDAAMERQKQQQDYEMRVRSRAAIDTVKSAFEMYGLQSLYPKVEEYATAGYNSDAIVMMLRQTPEYKARFPAMETMMKNGRAISESAYIEYERTTAQIEQRYGLPSGLLMGSVTDMLVNDVSVAEMNDRVTLAVADSMMAPQDLKDTLAEFYGLDPSTALAAYYLDPEKAMPLLEKQSASARIGVWATRQGVGGVGVQTAEELQALGLSEQQAQAGFGKVAGQAGLAAGRGDTASQQALIGANLKGTEADAAAVERAAKSRVGRFGSGGQFAATREGISGIGSSSS
jgi:hypothetical protein